MSMNISIIDVLAYYLAKTSVEDESKVTWNLVKDIRAKLVSFLNSGYISINYQDIPVEEYEEIDRVMLDLMIKDMDKIKLG